MQTYRRRLWLASWLLSLALVLPFAVLTAQSFPVTQWDPSESDLSALEPTWVGDVDLQGSPAWTWFVGLTASASQVLVAAPEDPEIPYDLGIDFDGSVQGSQLQMSFMEPGVYVVTIYYQDPKVPTRTYMIFAGAKKGPVRCDPRVFGIRKFTPPARDLYTVNSTTPDGYLDCARVAVPAAVNVNGWNALKNAIDGRFMALRRPITVFAISHGDVSSQTPAPGFTIFNNNANVQTMTALPNAGGVRGRVSRWDAFSCCTGAGINNPPAGGPHLLDALVAGFSVLPGLRANASGYDRITICLPTGRRRASLFTVRGATLVVR